MKQIAEEDPFQGLNFHESFLMAVDYHEWPNNCGFRVWSPEDEVCYCIEAKTILEFHFLRTGTGPLLPTGEGIALYNVHVLRGEEYDYWSERILAFAQQGYDDGESPYCLEFDSHLFANRRKKMLTRNRDTGLLVVCRSLTVVRDERYDGPRPFPHRIPSVD